MTNPIKRAISVPYDAESSRNTINNLLAIAGFDPHDPLPDGPLSQVIKNGITRDVELIARVCHEVNRAYCAALGDDSQMQWDDAPDWQKDSARNGVQFHLSGEQGPEDSHNSWLAQKEADGWKYGPVKDAEKKEHPCFVPYEQLPREQRVKDYLFRAVVHAFK